MRPFAFAAVLVFCCLRAVVAQAAAAEFKLTPDTIRADEQGFWRTNLLLENHGEWGLYADSLFMDWVSEDPDSSRKPRHGTQPLVAFARIMEPAGGGGSTSLEWGAPAEFARGRLTFRLYLHDGKQNLYPFSADAVVTGSLLDDLHPSRMLTAAGHAGKHTGGTRAEGVVELIVTAADSSAWPAPGVLMVPPPGTSARSLLRSVLGLNQRGYSVGIVSLPGSGRSAGSDDRSGPASVAAVEAALAQLAHEPGFAANRLVLWGTDGGASTALLAASRHPELAAVIAQNACYDPWAAYRALPAAEQAAYVLAAGSDSAAWRARSPLAAATRITAPVLVLQTDEPGAPDAAAAQAFAEARADQKLFIEARISASEGHPFHKRDASRVAHDFLARRTR